MGCVSACVSVLRCSFGSRQIKCIHLHPLAGVSLVTCWNGNALLPPETQIPIQDRGRYTIHVVSLYFSLSLCPLSFVSRWFLILHSVQPPSLLPHMCKCLRLLFQSGSVSLWHLTDRTTAQLSLPSILNGDVHTRDGSYAGSCQSTQTCILCTHIFPKSEVAPLFDTRLLADWIHHYFLILLYQCWEN